MFASSVYSRSIAGVCACPERARKKIVALTKGKAPAARVKQTTNFIAPDDSIATSLYGAVAPISMARHLLSLCLATAVAAACTTNVRPRVPGTSIPPASVAPAAPSASDVDPTTLDRKLMFGYQGWFGCPGDGSPLDAWEHWFRRGAAASAATLRVDMWPDVSELSEERTVQHAAHAAWRASRAAVFRLQRRAPSIVTLRWLQEYDLPGVFLQRFTVRLDDPSMLGFRDGVARNVRAAAEAHGRVFAMMYDISGHSSGNGRGSRQARLGLIWSTPCGSPRARGISSIDGRPVLAIWGFGFRDRAADAGSRRLRSSTSSRTIRNRDIA